jgi:predicted nucleic acid-binding protein
MPEPLVIDASFAYRVILPGHQQSRFRSLVAQWLQDGHELVAPALWLYEITSALCKAVRFSELTPEEGERALALARSLGVDLIPPDSDQAYAAFQWTVRLNRGAAYDSFYLALAERLQCPLWTADRRLCNAVDQSWVRYAGD